MKKLFLIAIAILALIPDANAFCGFYVAKADVQLFNATSQVIITRNKRRSVITMSNDFKGKVDDFAMVVPVPVVLKREQIRTFGKYFFDKLNDYSGARLVEYHDPDPGCYDNYADKDMEVEKELLYDFKKMRRVPMTTLSNSNGVTVQAQYQVAEYDIAILSAENSAGLEIWLNDNGYKIPAKAREVLEPYVKNNLKFFVVKVDKTQLVVKADGSADLSPLQIEFNSPKFELPIRLGMANSNGTQDMLVYLFTEHGRAETVNYRTVKIPTDRNIPKVIKDKGQFGEMYVSLFDRAWQRENKSGVFLEYAWDISPTVPIKCDPCVGPEPNYSELERAGVNWLRHDNNRMHGSVFFTRLHVRYDRQHFPQDLVFQETPNKSRFQGRYVVHNPAPTRNFSCDNGQIYIRNLHLRRKTEVDELVALTGWNAAKYSDYVTEFDQFLEKPLKSGDSALNGFAFDLSDRNSGGPVLFGIIILLTLFGAFAKRFKLL